MAYVVSLFVLAMSISHVSHVEFKKWPYRPVKSGGHGPYNYMNRIHGITTYMSFVDPAPLVAITVTIISYIVLGDTI